MPAPYSYPDTPPDYQETAAALSYIPVPSSHDEWYRYAIAIKSALGEDGFDLWDDWSRQGEGYDPRQTRAVWKSANPRAGGITWRTLMKSAREHGYKSERRYTPPDAAQVAAQKQREREQAARTEQEQAAQHRAAERTAYGIWTNALPADPSHPYLQNKGINNPEILRSIRQNEYNGQRQLVIPLYQDNKLVSVQTINEDGSKRILKGSKKSGSHTAIGSLKNETHKGAVAVAEGWATAASIRQATGLPVIAAIDKGNMIYIAEKLARTLPPSTTVIFAADNDPSGGGLEAAQKAAALLGSRGFAVQPEFKAEHIAQFQAKYGARNETKNRENLPTDFNDLHLLVGENSVRARFAPVLERIRGQRAVENGHQQETDFMQPEIPAAMQPQTAEISAQKTVNPNTAAAETAAVSLPQTQDHDMAQQPENAQPETPSQLTEQHEQPENAIEYGGITQEQQSEPQAAEDIMQQNAARYPETIQAAPPEAAARQPETSIPPQAQQQPEIPPRAERQPETETPETPSAASPETTQKPKPILDFDYATPAGFEARYLRVEGKYLDLDNRQTVMFQDKGAKIKTARTDAQTIRDMLDTAQAKNWDSIKISGSRDFKQQMWLEAELRGIASTGYTPSKADLALRDQMLQERQRNSIEADVRAERRPPPLQMPEAAPRQPESAQSSPKPPPQAGERILAHGAAPYLHKQDNSMNYFVRLQAADGSVREKWGVLLSEALHESGADTGDLIRLEDKGKQPVTVQRQVKDAQGNVIGSEKIQTERNVFAIDVLERASVRQPENPIHFDKVPLPDEAVHLRSETEKLQKRAETPEQHAAADRAAADVETAVAEQRAQPDAGQSAGNMEAARNAYQQKATQLSAEAKSNLDAVHALIAKAAENMSDRQSADKIMLNFYRNAPDYMRGTDFELGKYLSSATQQTKTQQSSAPQQNDDMEIDR